MSNNKKRNIIIGSLCAIVLLMAVGYAAFQTVLNIQGTSNITSSWNVKITKVESKNIKGTASNNGDPSFEELSATFKTSLQAPGDSIEYDITVTNAGSLDAKLDEITLSDTNNPAIKFTASGMTQGDVITAGNTKVLTVKVEYLSSVSEQPTNPTSTLTVDLDYSQSTNSLPTRGDAASILISTMVTSGDGLYEDTYEPGRYVYKGASPNNYITFNDEEWRIISVEDDSTLKIINTSSIGTIPFNNCRVGEFDHTIKTCPNGKNFNDWTGASINTYLNNNYYEALSSTTKSKIQNHSFNAGEVVWENTDIVDQIVNEKSTTWSGNIGLISVSDYLKANSNTSECINLSNNNQKYDLCNKTNYLFDSKDYWAINGIKDDPEMGFIVYGEYSDGVFYESGGRIDACSVLNYPLRTRPVLYLKSDITLSGDGTKNNPYIID